MPWRPAALNLLCWIRGSWLRLPPSHICCREIPVQINQLYWDRLWSQWAWNSGTEPSSSCQVWIKFFGFNVFLTSKTGIIEREPFGVVAWISHNGRVLELRFLLAWSLTRFQVVPPSTEVRAASLSRPQLALVSEGQVSWDLPTTGEKTLAHSQSVCCHPC